MLRSRPPLPAINRNPLPLPIPLRLLHDPLPLQFLPLPSFAFCPLPGGWNRIRRLGVEEGVDCHPPRRRWLWWRRAFPNRCRRRGRTGNRLMLLRRDHLLGWLWLLWMVSHPTPRPLVLLLMHHPLPLPLFHLSPLPLPLPLLPLHPLRLLSPDEVGLQRLLLRNRLLLHPRHRLQFPLPTTLR